MPLIPVEADETQTTPVEMLNYRAFRYQKTLDLSIDHLGRMFAEDDLEFQIGNPEVGLPFWSSGEARLWLTMRNQIGTESDFQIGFDFPNFALGDVNQAIFEPRELSGFYGGSVAAYFAGIDFFSAFNMPIAFNFSVFPAGGSNSSIIYDGTRRQVQSPLRSADETPGARGTQAVVLSHFVYRANLHSVYRAARSGEFRAVFRRRWRGQREVKLDSKERQHGLAIWVRLRAGRDRAGPSI